MSDDEGKEEEEEPGVVEGVLVPELGDEGGSRCRREICSRANQVWISVEWHLQQCPQGSRSVEMMLAHCLISSRQGPWFCCWPPPLPIFASPQIVPSDQRGSRLSPAACRRSSPPPIHPSLHIILPPPLSPLPQCPSAPSPCPAARTSVHAPAPAGGSTEGAGRDQASHYGGACSCPPPHTPEDRGIT